MLQPKPFIVVLILVPILIDSSPQQFQNFGNRQTAGCTDHAQCGIARYCNGFGRCADNPCSRVDCPAGTSCRVDQGRAICEQRGGCTENSQCRKTGYCNGLGRCDVNPCSSGRCPAGTRCLVDFGNVICQQIEDCNDDNHCGNDKLCVSRSCVDPCDLVQCPGPTCHVREKQPQCLCPSSTQRGTFELCLPLKGCVTDRQCRQNEQCRSGVCVDLCNSVQCGQGAFCQVFERKPKCFCRPNIQGDPNIQCLPTQAIDVGNRQSDLGGSAIQGSNQSGTAQGDNQEEILNARPKECTKKSQCRNEEICEKGTCADPCDLIDCGQGAMCKVIDIGNGPSPQCICPPGTTGLPSVKCTPIQESTINDKTQPSPGSNGSAASGCKINSQCGTNERCQSGSCVNPCVSIKCVEGAVCQVAQRQGRCVCPAGTVGNPREQCKTKTGNVASVTQKPASVINPPASTSGTNPDISFPDERNQTQPVQAPGKGTRLQGCETEPDPGECRGAFPRYYFNKAKNQCDCFLFGGCDIEGVKFTWPTFEECLSKCVPENTTKGSGCKRVSVDEVKEFLEQQRRDRENNGR